MPKKTALTDPNNFVATWDEEPPVVPAPETPAARRKRLRPAPKPLRRGGAGR